MKYILKIAKSPLMAQTKLPKIIMIKQNIYKPKPKSW